MKVQKVLLSRIDTSCEGWDSFILEPEPRVVDRLAQSLDHVGQIHPLVLRKDMEWLFIVCGWARFLALQKLGVDEAWARIYQKNEMDDEQALWMSLEEDCSCEFSNQKQKRVLERFRDLVGYSEKILAEKVAPAIGLEPNIEAVRKVLGK